MKSDSDARGSTEALISRLADEVTPVRRTWPPRGRFALWLALEVAVLAVAWHVLGLRPDVASKLGSGRFVAEIGLLVVVGIASSALALLAAVPGREPARAITLGAVAGIVGTLGLAYSFEGSIGDTAHQLGTGWPCAARTIAVAAAPWLVSFIAVRRGASLVPARAGLLAAMAAFFIAGAALRLNCPLDASEHLLLWHLGAVVFGLGASVVAGRRWLARWRR